MKDLPNGWETYWFLRTTLQVRLDDAIELMRTQRPTRTNYDSTDEFREAQALSEIVREEWRRLNRTAVRRMEIFHSNRELARQILSNR